MTYQEAKAKLPADAAWSCSFGNPGEEQYHEYWRAAGRRYELAKIDHYADTWSVTER
jgi:hypothetical protein